MEPLSQRGIWQYLTKLHTHLLLDLAIPLLSIYSDNKITNMKQQVHKIIQSIVWGFPGGAVVESLPANAGDTGSSPGPGRSHMPQSN